MKYADIEVGIDFDPEPGLADNGDLEHDLQALLEVAGRAAQAADTALVMFVDELQYVEEEQLASLITALHRCAQQKVPVMLVGAGLPQLPGQMGRAKSYAERLFDFPFVGPLDAAATREALEVPAAELGVSFEPAAIQRIAEATQGYPYFSQEWGKHAWNVADASPITTQTVDIASREVTAALDESFFRVRFDRLTPAQKRYLRAMAEMGPGPHRSGDIATVLERKVTALGPTRNQLIAKGMVWSPSHGDTAFTVPLPLVRRDDAAGILGQFRHPQAVVGFRHDPQRRNDRRRLLVVLQHIARAVDRRDMRIAIGVKVGHDDLVRGEAIAQVDHPLARVLDVLALRMLLQQLREGVERGFHAVRRTLVHVDPEEPLERAGVDREARQALDIQRIVDARVSRVLEDEAVGGAHRGIRLLIAPVEIHQVQLRLARFLAERVDRGQRLEAADSRDEVARLHLLGGAFVDAPRRLGGVPPVRVAPHRGAARRRGEHENEQQAEQASGHPGFH